MDNNVSKNRFFSRSIQLDLTLDKISIKQTILKQLQNSIIQRLVFDEIAIYRTQNSIPKNPDQVLTSLSDKVILQDNSDFPSLVYCSAIAFPIANLCGLSSLQVAQELVFLLPINTQESAAESTLQFTVRVIENGLIEFVFSDRSIGLWLEFGVGRRGDKRCDPADFHLRLRSSTRRGCSTRRGSAKEAVEARVMRSGIL